MYLFPISAGDIHCSALYLLTQMKRIYEWPRCHTRTEIEHKGVVVLPFRPWCPKCTAEMNAIVGQGLITKITEE